MSYPPVVCWRGHVLFALFVYVSVQWCSTRSVLCFLFDLSSSCVLYMLVSSTYIVLCLLFSFPSTCALCARGCQFLWIVPSISLTCSQYLVYKCTLSYETIQCCILTCYI